MSIYLGWTGERLIGELYWLSQRHGFPEMQFKEGNAWRRIAAPYITVAVVFNIEEPQIPGNWPWVPTIPRL